MRRAAKVATAVVAVGLLSAGCSSSDEAEQKTENANAAVCLSLEGLDATISGLADGVTGTGDVTVGKAQESINQIDEAYDTVKEQITKLGQDVDQDVLTAQEEFAQAQAQIKEGLSGLDGDQSLADVPESEASAINSLERSYQDLNSSLGCSNASQ